MIHYYIQTASGQEGPFTLEELRHENLQSKTPVWYEGIHDWTPAGKIEALSSIIRPAILPPPFAAAPPVKTSEEFPEEKKSPGGFDKILVFGMVIVLIIIGVIYYSTRQKADFPAQGIKPRIDTSGKTQAVESPQDLERKRQAAKLAARNKNYRNHWDKYIKAEPGRYNVDIFGGISNLEAVIRNKTDYPLDVVILAITYIKDNGDPYSTQYVTAYQIPANGKASVPAPDSDRGTSVQFRIIQISSRKMNFLYSDDIPVDGKEDPYYFNRK
jgi:hypothetical protein